MHRAKNEEEEADPFLGRWTRVGRLRVIVDSMDDSEGMKQQPK